MEYSYVFILCIDIFASIFVAFLRVRSRMSRTSIPRARGVSAPQWRNVARRNDRVELFPDKTVIVSTISKKVIVDDHHSLNHW